jgi:hypothetical protein
MRIKTRGRSGRWAALFLSHLLFLAALASAVARPSMAGFASWGAPSLFHHVKSASRLSHRHGRQACRGRQHRIRLRLIAAPASAEGMKEADATSSSCAASAVSPPLPGLIHPPD